MNNQGVSIYYGDVAIGAKENFEPTMQNITDFSDPSVLKKNDVSFKPYGNPCELYSVLLEGSAIPFPSETNGKNFGIWGNELSDENGYFNEKQTLKLYSSELFTSSGISLVFDKDNGIFPVDVSVKWYRGEDLIEEESFSPDSSEYFFNKKVEYYDGVVFDFNRLNMPFNRLKIRSIEFGIGVVFFGTELRNVKIIQEIDPISSQLTINTSDFTIDSKRNIDFSFQSQQPISIYFNGQLKATTFVNDSKRKEKNIWSIKSEDYVGLMDSIPFMGGLFYKKNAYELVCEIFSVANIPFYFEEILKNAEISGYIPYTNCREALKQVAFAIGAVVDTSGSQKVNIFSLSKEVSQEIPKSRVLQGQTSSKKNIVTSVELVSHSYVQSEEESVFYDAKESGYGENIMVIFTEPLHGLRIENGEIIESGTNYAIINSEESCLLYGKKYQHTKTKKSKRNPLVSKTDIENIISIENATLISNDNVDNILNLCYNYIVNRVDINAKIIDGKHVLYGEPIKYGEKKYGSFVYDEKKDNITTFDKPTNVGDIVIVDAGFIGNVTARITKQTYNLLGGTIVKNTELR